MAVAMNIHSGSKYAQGYKAAAEYIGKSESTVKRLRASKQLKGFKVGRDVRFEKSELDRYLSLQRD